MTLSLPDCSFFGPALPEPFVKLQLEDKLAKLKLLPKVSGAEGKKLHERWEVYRRHLRALGEQGGATRVLHHVLEPLVERLGYATLEPQEASETREGLEDGGYLFTARLASDAASQTPPRLRAWSYPLGTDLDAPNKRGRAYRFSPSRVAQRVLLAAGERVGLLTDGEELRLLICDPARPDSHIAIRLDRAGGWRASRDVPDSYRLFVALASPAGVRAVPSLTEEARLAQSTVTKKLRLQARRAVEGFIQEVLDHPENQAALSGLGLTAPAPHAPTAAPAADPQVLARQLWHEGLVLVYRLLFIFKLESSADPARAFSFATHSLWRNTYSPNTALGELARKVIDEGADTGQMLEGGLRVLWRMFALGMRSSDLNISPLGGMLFGEGTTPTLDRLQWGERAVAHLLDSLLWTIEDGKAERQHVHYGALDVEDLGRVYEALLELEPGISTEPMCRLRRAKLEVVLPSVQGAPYIKSTKTSAGLDGDAGGDLDGGPDATTDTEASDADDEDTGSAKTRVQFIEEIPAGRFYLRVGLGRKASGSYYTPHPFVRFLVQETLGPQVAERSPPSDPQPAKILELNVLDPAMGSGHFLVEACRYLGDALYEACRLCDERALEAEAQAEKEKRPAERDKLLARALDLCKRVEDLPDPDDELLAYLPSRVPEGQASGLSLRKAEAMCRRLAAVHCLYGVDKNPLAVELAKLSLWLESYAEGLPLTFLDHRLVCGDSLTGPFFEHLATRPSDGEPIAGLFEQGLAEQLQAALQKALSSVLDLEASVGKDVADLDRKRQAKEHLDRDLQPFKLLAAVWSGGVMLGSACDDDAYIDLAHAVANAADAATLTAQIDSNAALRRMHELGREGVAFELSFPEVFHDGGVQRRGGFHAVIGNPPWDAIQPKAKEFYAAYDLRIIDAPTRRERAEVEQRLQEDPAVTRAYQAYLAEFDAMKAITARLTKYVGLQAGGRSSGAVSDVWQVFAERSAVLLRDGGLVGIVLPSAFHANQSATGIRQLYLEHLALRSCFSFENRNKLFDIDSRFKFAPVVACREEGGTKEFDCAFYLHDLEWLFTGRQPMRYTLEFVKKTGGEYLSLLELRTPADTDVAQTMYRQSVPLGQVLDESSIRCGEEIHMSKGSHLFTPTDQVLKNGEDPRTSETAADLRARGYLPLHEGKTFHQYDDRWGERPRYLVAIEALADKPDWLKAAGYYRLAFRDIASSTNERTGIFSLLPPGVVCGNKAPCEREAGNRPTCNALLVGGVADSFAFDFILRTKVQATVNLFILNGCPFPKLDEKQRRFLAHNALRLTCNHAGYAALWEEQLGSQWREATAKKRWPVLDGDDARWKVRADIDAVVADAYGLDRAQYEHVLASFSHRSYPKAPELCLAAFDELRRGGREKFCLARDPYSDVGLNEEKARAVIELVAQHRGEPTDESAQTRGHFGRRSSPNTRRQLQLLAEERPPDSGEDRSPEPGGAPETNSPNGRLKSARSS